MGGRWANAAWLLYLCSVLALAVAGCGGNLPEGSGERSGGSEATGGPETSNGSEKTSRPAPPAGTSIAQAVREGVVRDSETFPLSGASTLLGHGEGSLWVHDYGDYRCDDTIVVEPSGASGGGSASAAACAAPATTFLRRIDPKTGSVTATVPMGGANVWAVAFGAGTLWIARDSPSGAEVLGLGPETNEVTRRFPVAAPGGGPSGLAFGEGALWVAGYRGTVTRIDPETGSTTSAEIGHDGLGGVAVGEGAVWVASRDTLEGIDPKGYEGLFERGEYPEDGHPGRNALLRLDPNSGRVAARIPIARTEPEGGAGSVKIGEGAVWVTSNNGKLLRVDPDSNEVGAELPLGDYPGDLAASGGSVWATSQVVDLDEDGGTRGLLTRVDPEDGRIVTALEIPGGASGLAAGDGAVWFTTGGVETGEGTLTRVEP